MALIWRQLEGDTSYEVRSAGSSIRLYTNGAFHSQYSPKHLFTGGVWDLLSVPTQFQPSKVKQPASVLMLGVGGGSAIHQLNTLLQPESIVGIEFNPVHLKVAKKYFGLRYPNLQLIEADAFDWIKKHKRKFDVIVDDLFIHAEADPVRPFALDQHWLKQLDNHLTDKGILIQNHLDRRSAAAACKALKSRFQSALLFTTPQYENVVCGFFRCPVDRKLTSQQVKKHIRETHGDTKKLDFQAKRLF